MLSVSKKVTSKLHDKNHMSSKDLTENNNFKNLFLLSVVAPLAALIASDQERIKKRHPFSPNSSK